MNMEETSVRLARLEERVARLEQYLPSEGVVETTRAKQISPREFLLTKTIKSEVQKTLALAYFLEHSGSADSFNVADLEAAFRSAKEKLPKNMNDVVNKNIARGFMMEAKNKKESKKAWHLTSTGERFVEQQLN